MSAAGKSEGDPNVRPSWGGKLGKGLDPPPPARSEEEKTSRPSPSSTADIDTRRVDLQLRGTELALAATKEEIHRLRGQLVTSRREAEGLRMTLAQVRDLVSRGGSTT